MERLKQKWAKKRSFPFLRGVIMVDLGGYVIILVETNDKRVKLYGNNNH